FSLHRRLASCCRERVVVLRLVSFISFPSISQRPPLSALLPYTTLFRSSLAAAKSASVDSRAMLPTLTIMAARIQLHATELVDVFLTTEVSPGHRSSFNARTTFDAGRVSAPATLSLATSSPATSSEATSPDVTPSGGCAEVGLVLIAHDRSAPPDWQ